MKLKPSTPLVLERTPPVVFVKGEKTLSIATKYAVEAGKPVPVAVTALVELA